MARLSVEVTPDTLADLLSELPAEQLQQVLAALTNRIEVREWMFLSEPTFEDWLAEPDLYRDDPAGG